MPLAAVGNNKFELLERLAAAGTRVLTDCRIDGIEGAHLRVRIGTAEPKLLPVGTALVFATGPRPDRNALGLVEASGIPHALVGDCNVPGDFLSGLRDAWMVGLVIDTLPAGQSSEAPDVPRPTTAAARKVSGATA